MLKNLDIDQISQRITRLECEEDKLWRISLLFLALLGTALAAAVWHEFANIPQNLQVIPLGALVLAVLFSFYAAGRRRELADLRGMVRGIQETVSAPPTQEQLGQLVQAITESQRNYRELIDSFDEVIVTLSVHGIIQAANRAFTRFLDREFSEIVGHSIEEFLLEPTREQADRVLEKFADRRNWSGMLRLRLKRNGELRYFECVLNPIWNEHGELTAVSVLASDVTHDRERETQFSELFESLPQGVFLSAPDGRLLDCNAALATMLGYESKAEVLTALPEALYFSPAERAEALRDTSAPLPFRDTVLRHRTGRPVHCIESSRPVFDGAGKLLRHQGVLIDVTGQRGSESHMQEQHRFLERLVEQFPDVVVVVDRNEAITFANARLRDVFDYSPESIVGEPMNAAGSPIAGESFRKLFAAMLAGKVEDGTAEYMAQHRDGSWRAVRTSARAIREEDGQLTCVLACTRDVTGFRQMERQLIQTERLAAIGQMIDGFAHELNNPLTAIVGSIDLLEGNLDENAARKLQMLKEQAKRAVSIVQNLLFFSRPPVPGGARLNLSEVVQRTIALQEHSLLLNHITVDFIPEPALPPVLGDPNQLMQVFLNLLINAEQAIREVRDRGTIRIRLGTNNQKVWVSMQDDGPGITQETIQKMYDPFYTTKRPGRGMGLGLSVSIAILKEYSGTIDAQPGPGGGAVFTVSLPLKRETATISTQAVQQA